MEKFAGKVAVVTGSSSGIGEAISKALLKEGVVVVGLATRIHKLQELSNEISKHTQTYKGKFHGVQCDIRNEKEIQEVFQHIKTNIGPISILVNNAGVAGGPSTAANFDNTFDTNVKGLLLCTEEAMSSMKSNGDSAGHIININSIISLPFFKRDPTFNVYAASKSAARVFSEILRSTVSKEKQLIKVTDISPGLTKTPAIEKVADILKESQDEMKALTAEEIANACIFALNTPKNVLISELTIMPIHQQGI